jgi:multicomponent K+:H+ antiporter subunit D
LLVVVAVARSGSALFWRTAGDVAGVRPPPPRARSVAPIAGLLACMLGMLAWGDAATSFAWSTARQLARPAGYVAAVLGSVEDVVDGRRRLK